MDMSAKDHLRRGIAQCAAKRVTVCVSLVSVTSGLAAQTPVLTPSAEGGQEQGVIGVQNSSGRSGAYFVPAGPHSQPVPLLAILHGTGGSGQRMLLAFLPLAQARRFAIVALDSRQAPNGELTWEVGDHQGEVTEDLTHIVRCVEWVQQHTGLTVDKEHILIAGYSGGGSSAPYVASNRGPFTHAAVLHGGVFAGGLGPRRPRVWFSTGEQDPARPVAGVRQAADAMTKLGFQNVAVRTYPGGHALSLEEIRDLSTWWLGQ